MIQINRVSNGFTMITTNDDGKQVEVFEEFIEDDPETLQRFLYTLLERLEVYTNNQKYNDKQLFIEVRHGTHYVCTDNDCECKNS